MLIWELIFSLLLIPVALVDYLIQIPVNFPSTPATINGQNFTLYTASNFTQWQQGFKDWDVKKDEAMLFEFSNTTTRHFWMKGTKTSLDIVFLDASYIVTNIVEGATPCRIFCKNYMGRAKYVLEFKANTAKALGFEPGKKIELTRN
ncbi:MAG: hypothetical protein GOU98_00500 [Candidatus Altiarchaeota archaeon]|nr:hypothetical protein [Candidatus Altiarchaeota archaeon]